MAVETNHQQAIERLLRKSLSVRRIAQNPSLPTLLSWVRQHHDLPKEVTRTEIYEFLVQDFLCFTRRGEGPDEKQAVQLLLMLQEVALDLFLEGKGTGGITYEKLLKRRGNSSVAERILPSESVANLARELEENRLVAPIARDTAYAFPHRSMVEFLAANELSDRMNSRQKTERQRTWRIIDKKAWDPDWEQVIVFLAGRLSGSKDALNKLFSILSDQSKDDLFRHRLALAALCLAEIPRPRRKAFSTEIDTITRAVYSRVSTREPFFYSDVLNRAWPALASVNGRIGSVRLLTHSLRTLAKGHGKLRSPQFLGEMGPAAATPEVLAGLARLIDDPDQGVRHDALSVLRSMGSAAAAPEILARLTELLQDRDIVVQRLASDALEITAGTAATPEIIERLLQLLDDSDQYLRSGTFAALSNIGSAAATPRAVARLLELLEDPDPDQRRSALIVLRNMGSAAPRAEIFARILKMLDDPDPNAAIRGWTLTAIDFFFDWAAGGRETLEGAATRENLHKLQELLHNPNPQLRRWTLEALKMMGWAGARVVATPEILLWVTKQLHMPDTDLRWTLDALSGLGPAAATPEILDELLRYLSNPPASLWSWVLKALEEMRGAAVTPEILSRLLQLLHHSKEDVWYGTFAALRGMGRAAATPAVLAALLDLLDTWICLLELSTFKRPIHRAPAALAGLPECRDIPSLEVRFQALYTLREMGSAAATPEILARLLELTRGPLGLQQEALHVLGAMGSAATTPAVLERLLELLDKDLKRPWPKFQDRGLQPSTLSTLGEMGSAAATPEILKRLLELLRDRALRVSTYFALCEMGTAAMTPRILASIRKMLRDPDLLHGLPEDKQIAWEFEISGSTRKALRGLEEQGLRLFERPSGRILVRKVRDLGRIRVH